MGPSQQNVFQYVFRILYDGLNVLFIGPAASAAAAEQAEQEAAAKRAAQAVARERELKAAAPPPLPPVADRLSSVCRLIAFATQCFAAIRFVSGCRSARQRR